MLEKNKYNLILKDLGATKDTCNEILEYCKNKFNVENYKPQKIEDEPFVEIWQSIIDEINDDNITEVMNKRIPVIYAKDEKDFYEIVKKLIYKGMSVPNIEKTGASFAYGKTNKFIILSNKPYSNIPAQKLGLEEEQWRNYSIIIRREHECTHYFTKRFLGSSQNNLHDELIADFTGIMCASGGFKAKWFLAGMGLDMYPEPQEIGRFPVYTSSLSNEAAEIMKKIIIKVANNVEKWSKKESVKQMSRNERVLFLCSKSILDLYIQC